MGTGVYRTRWDRRHLLWRGRHGVVPGTGFSPASASIPIHAVPRLEPPRVYLHDGDGREIGALTQLQAVSRAFTLNERTTAHFQVLETDPRFSQLAPEQGRIVTIRSVNHPPIWAGELVHVEAPVGSPWASCRARSLESLLDWSPLEVDRTVEGEASSIIRELVERANIESPTGIVLDPNLEAGGVIEEPLSLAGRRLGPALDHIATVAGMEWWLDHRLDGTQLVTTLRLARRRGRDAYSSLLMAGPTGNIADRPGWSKTSEAGVHSVRVIGGAESATTAFASRSRALFQAGESGRVPGAELAAVDDVHGYPADESFAGLNPVTSRGRVLVDEFVRGTQGARALAQALLTNRRAVARSVTVQVAPNADGEAFWPDYEPGNILRLIVPAPTLGSGYDGPVRVLAVQPMEASGGGQGGWCQLALEVRGRKRDATVR